MATSLEEITNTMQQSPIVSDNPELHNPAARKGVFREVARDILRKDRDGRKYGVSQDTGGAIARALEQAYKLGLVHAVEGEMTGRPKSSDHNAPLAWTSLPSRPRAAFDSIVRFNWIVVLAPNAKPFAAQSDLWACYWDWGERKSAEARIELARTYAIATLQPIVRIGLMEESIVKGATFLQITAKGRDTWERGIRDGHLLPRRTT